MLARISIVAAVALLAFAPSASNAATKKKHHVATTSTTCAAGGCEGTNPDRVKQCEGDDPASCYKRSRTHLKKKSTPAQSWEYTAGRGWA